MKILVLGKDGQIGKALADRIWPKGIVPAWAGRADADLTNPDELSALLYRASADLIVNCAAYTNVDEAENNAKTAFAVNATAPAQIGTFCQSAGIPLLHFSTDYVFDGTKTRPYDEEDPVAPLGVYGASKAAGEDALRASGVDCWIWRTAWVFGPHGPNFVRTMLRAARQRDQLNIVDDQIGTPVPTPDLADAVIYLIKRWQNGHAELPFGTYHVAGDEPVTWLGLATAVFEIVKTEDLDWPCPDLIPITTDQWSTSAKRPANSQLDGTRAATVLGIHPIAWRPALPDIVKAIIRDLRKAPT